MWFDNEKGKIYQLINNGYAVMILEYFNYDYDGNLPSYIKNIHIEYFKNAIDLLLSKDEVNKNKLTIAGYSRGGELALILGTIYPEIDNIIAFVPSSYVWGLLAGTTQLCLGQPGSIKTNLFNNYINERKYQIPVERCTANFLLLSATRDRIWNSTEMAESIVSRLKENKYQYNYNHKSYYTSHGGVLPHGWDDVESFLGMKR